MEDYSWGRDAREQPNEQPNERQGGRREDGVPSYRTPRAACTTSGEEIWRALRVHRERVLCKQNW